MIAGYIILALCILHLAYVHLGDRGVHFRKDVVETLASYADVYKLGLLPIAPILASTAKTAGWHNEAKIPIAHSGQPVFDKQQTLIVEATTISSVGNDNSLPGLFSAHPQPSKLIGLTQAHDSAGDVPSLLRPTQFKQ